MKIPYWQLLVIPALVYGLGALLNYVVIGLNGAQMPVLWAGGCSTFAVYHIGDYVHACMTPSSHLKILSDWIVIGGEGTASPGDLLLWAADAVYLPFVYIWFANIVRDYNSPSRERYF